MDNESIEPLVDYLRETLDGNDKIGSPTNDARAWSVARALAPQIHNRTVSSDGKTVNTSYVVTAILEKLGSHE